MNRGKQNLITIGKYMGVSNIQLGQPPFWMMTWLGYPPAEIIPANHTFLGMISCPGQFGSKINKCHTDSTTVSFKMKFMD